MARKNQTTACPHHGWRHTGGCEECIAAVERFRSRKLLRLARLHASNEARRNKLPKKEPRTGFDRDGNCIVCEAHFILKSGKRFCPRCYPASRRHGAQLRKMRAANRRHDAAMKTPPVDLGLELWEVFVSDIWHKKAA